MRRQGDGSDAQLEEEKEEKICAEEGAKKAATSNTRTYSTTLGGKVSGLREVGKKRNKGNARGGVAWEK